MQDMLKKYGHFDWQRLVPLAILGASVSALAVAHTAEVVFSLEACNLCLYQRIPYLLAGTGLSFCTITNRLHPRV